MGICILEDNIFQNNYLEETIQLLCQQQHYDLGTVFTASHPKTLIDHCQASTESANLYFLDIKIKEKETAGLLVARQIRKLEPQAFIAFVTTYPEFALASYEYMTSAFAYILKTHDEASFQSKITDCLETYAQFLATQEPVDYFVYEDRFTSIKIPYKDLYYITPVSPHKISVRTCSREIYFHGTLKELEAAEPRLTRCHQSFLVNLNNARMIDRSQRLIIFTNDIAVPIARKSMRNVQDTWNELSQIIA